MKRLLRFGLILLPVILVIVLLAVRSGDRAGVRGKSPALPIAGEISSENQLAQDLALSDAAVIEYTTGTRSEVFNVVDTGIQYTQPSRACAVNRCRQVNIYNFDENETIAAIVNLDQRLVLDVLHQPGVLPAANPRLTEVAIEAILNAPALEEALGRKPARDEIMPMPSSLAGTDCGSIHPCLGAAFLNGEQFVWAHVDLTTERFAGLGWSPAPADHGTSTTTEPDSACSDSFDLDRDGWTLTYAVTASDGLRLNDVRFNNVSVLTSVKLVEWHADYGATGFVDAIGCSGGGGGFPIYPYGPTQVIDITGANQNVIGFEVVQDFRMNNWGQSCNYRYEQHNQFYQDGSFRIVAGSFGKGCGTNATYRPLIRIDLAVNGDDNDTFAVWDGSSYDDQAVEFWELQDGPYTAEGYAWRVMDTLINAGYTIEPGQGQFSDQGRGDNAFIYVVQHHPNEGDGDLGSIGACCNNNEEQGPHIYLDGETIADQNIVLWYVPQYVTDITPGSEYCWTLQGEPNPVTFPCFGGPMFHPFGFNFSGFELWLPLMQRDNE